MDIKFYKVHPNVPEIVPARSNRDWMDATMNRFAYRCLPLSIANATGWEVLCPTTFDILYTGGGGISDIRIAGRDPNYPVDALAASHFAHGVLTFHIGYLIRTPPGWGMFVTGAPNWPKDGLTPLAGLIQTDWLPFPFTMNWKLTRPGKYTFHKGEPFAFLMPVPHFEMEALEPKVYSLDSHPELKGAYEEWSQKRAEFNQRLHDNDPEAVKEGWQRWYTRGETPDGKKVEVRHTSKRKMKKLVPGEPGTATEPAR